MCTFPSATSATVRDQGMKVKKMKLDVSKLSYRQIERLVLSMPMGVEQLASVGNRVVLEVASPAF